MSVCLDAWQGLSSLGQDTYPSASAENLGVVFDSGLNFRKHI